MKWKDAKQNGGNATETVDDTDKAQSSVQGFTEEVVEEKTKSKPDKAKAKPGKKRGDLSSGMELLELDFLLSIVENTDGDDKLDITMRKLTFNEILRRTEQNEINSSSLTVYAINADDFFDKNIQCQALTELSRRTA